MGRLARPSVVAEVLEGYGLRLSRSLGQHILVDGNVLRRLVDAAGLSAADTVLEVGPGIGTLTEELCSRCGRVVAVEADRRMVAAMADLLGPRVNLEVVEGDAMRVDLSSLFSRDERVKVVSNLPYGIATPLIIRLLKELPQVEIMVVTVQRELADRYLATPASPAYGSVSAKVQSLCRVRRLSVLPPTVFFPPPQVQSAIVHLERKEPPLPSGEIEPFFRFLDACFSSRRKMLVNALGGGRSPHVSRSAVEEALRRLELSPTCRAEELPVERLQELFLLLHEREGGP